VDAPREAFIEVTLNETRFDLETIFYAQYERISRVIAGVTRDPARAEELAVEVFLKWSRSPEAQGDKAPGWLYRTAVRTGLNELRHQTRRSRFEGLFGFAISGPTRQPATPEDVRAAKEDQEKVRLVLSVMKKRQAELLVLHSHGFSYDELASTLDLNPASVGTLLSRALQAFRKEYIERYGEE
jgi:RNA polymerase sigma-70 factor (ECF subfamily)